jgi:hypothetical protein
MKKLIRALSIVLICASVGIGNPSVAQSSDPNTTTANSNNNNNDNDTGKWGLAGLLGLLGLLGLKKKDDDYRNRTTTSTNR